MARCHLARCAVNDSASHPQKAGRPCRVNLKAAPASALFHLPGAAKAKGPQAPTAGRQFYVGSVKALDHFSAKGGEAAAGGVPAVINVHAHQIGGRIRDDKAHTTAVAVASRLHLRHCFFKAPPGLGVVDLGPPACLRCDWCLGLPGFVQCPRPPVHPAPSVRDQLSQCPHLCYCQFAFFVGLFGIRECLRFAFVCRK